MFLPWLAALGSPTLDKNSYPISLAHASYILLIEMKVSSLLKLVGRQIKAFKNLDSNRFTPALPLLYGLKPLTPNYLSALYGHNFKQYAILKIAVPYTR